MGVPFTAPCLENGEIENSIATTTTDRTKELVIRIACEWMSRRVRVRHA